MKIISKFLLCLWIIVLAFGSLWIGLGCATYEAPKQYNIEKERIFTADYDSVWNKCVEWFALNGTPVKNLDKVSGFIASDLNLSIGSFERYSDCGKGGHGLLNTMRVTEPVGHFNLLVRTVNKTRTRVHITVSFSATLDHETFNRYGNDHSYSKVECVSTGAFEKALFDYIGK